VLVTGAAGAAEYGDVFRQSADRWEQTAVKAGFDIIRIGCGAETAASGPAATNDVRSASESDRGLLEQALADLPRETTQPLWLVLIGHGTFNGRQAKFNLRGADVSAAELAEWLEPLARPLVIANCASSSAPFLKALSGPDRIVITATKSGYEQNYARFGEFLSQAVAEQSVDLDKDEQTSILEAFLWASKRVAEFYETETRLATEHALLDDNGDQLGTPAEFFEGVRATKSAQDGQDVDGLRANQVSLLPGSRFRELDAEQRAALDALELARKYREFGLFDAQPDQD
jgi:hypothetical protein